MVAKSTISSLFGRSPVKPLQQHIQVATQCAGEVIPLFEALCDGDKKELQKVVDRIFQLESDADHLKNELREHLPKSLFMPMDRSDLLQILDLQDSIADTAQDIAGLLQIRDFEVPETLKEPLMAMVHRCVDACKLCDKIINELDELVATGFRGRESEIVGKMVRELNKVESDTDMMGTNLARDLFKLEGEVSAVSLILWFRLILEIGSLADYSEMVGNRLLLLIAR